jgi:hypothetical protein
MSRKHQRGFEMKLVRSFPVSLLVILGAILSIPAIAYGSFHCIYPADPNAVYTKHGQLEMEWKKFSENDSFTEYLGKEMHFDEELLTADILVLRSYQKSQTSIHENSRISYSSVVMHQTVNCRNRTVSVQDLLMFSSGFSRGALVRGLYELDWDLGSAKPGSIDEKKVANLCEFLS